MGLFSIFKRKETDERLTDSCEKSNSKIYTENDEESKRSEELYAKGNEFLKLKKYQEAIASYDKALEINNNHLDAWFNKGIALHNLGEPEEQTVGQITIKSNPGKPQEELVCFDKVLKINPEHAEAWLKRGIALHDLGRYEDANASYDRVLEINPKCADAWHGKRGALWNLGKHDDALEAIRMAKKLEQSV